MFVTITHNEIRKGAKGDYLYIKYITSKGRESGKAVFGELREKWGLCQNGARIELKLDGAPNYNVLDVLAASPEDEPPPNDEVEDVPFEEPKPPQKPVPQHIISGEERGMWFKEMGNRIGDGTIEKEYPKAHIKIKTAYFKKMQEVTGINFVA